MSTGIIAIAAALAIAISTIGPGIGQGLAAGGDGGVIGSAGGGNFGEGDVYGNGGILVVLRIGLIIISNC